MPLADLSPDLSVDLSADFWVRLESLPLAAHIGETWWFPLLESIHVLAAALVLGSILMTDLRLIGVAARSYAVTTLLREAVPWTWVAFAVAVITGAGLFITRAATYIENPAFQLKLVLLALAGLNMGAFHFGTFRTVSAWDTAALPTSAARIAGAGSLLIWSGVMLAGRWVGHLQ